MYKVFRIILLKSQFYAILNFHLKQIQSIHRIKQNKTKLKMCRRNLNKLCKFKIFKVSNNTLKISKQWKECISSHRDWKEFNDLSKIQRNLEKINKFKKCTKNSNKITKLNKGTFSIFSILWTIKKKYIKNYYWICINFMNSFGSYIQSEK